MFCWLRFVFICFVVSGLWGCGDSRDTFFYPAAPPPAGLVSLSISPSSLTLAQDTSAQLQATGSFSDGRREDLTEQVIWSSAQPSVAEVHPSEGRVTALRPGVATISASLAGLNASSTVVVSEATLQSLQLSPSNLTLAAGTSGPLVVRGTFSDGTFQDLSSQAVWTSSRPAVALASEQPGESGRVRALAVGTTTITATVGARTASSEVEVTNAALTRLLVTPPAPALAGGTSTQLQATGIYSDDSTQDLTDQVRWSSSQPKVATVTSPGGAVLALATGQTVVTARSGNVSGDATVTVTPAVLRSLAVTPSTAQMPRGTELDFVATGTLSDGSTQDLSSQVEWKSSSSALSISNAAGTYGRATALLVETGIQVTASLDGLQGTAQVQVTEAALRSLAVTPASPTVVQRGARQLTATGTYTDGSTRDLTSEVDWSSGTESVVGVTAGGVLKGRVNPGVALAQSVVSASLDGVSGNTTATVALVAGRAFGAGANSQGQLGTGNSSDSYVPTAVADGSIAFSFVSAGLDHSVGLAGDGRAYAWGRGAYGRLGTGNTSDAFSPQLVVPGQIPSGVALVQVAAGAYHTVALGSDGKLYAWGLNTNGQLGDGSSTNRLSPVAVSPGAIPVGTSFVAVAAGEYHSLALGSDGSLYSWGWNVFGQLGDGTTVSRATPGPVANGALPEGASWVEISSEGSHVLALASNGRVYAWGPNYQDQLGYPGVMQSDLPREVAPGALPVGISYTAISAGTYHSLALGSDGKVYSWGDNFSQQLGDGTNSVSASEPVAVAQGAVPAGLRFTAIEAGYGHNLALGSDGRVYAWGEYYGGQFGTGTRSSTNVPVLAGQQGLAGVGWPVTLIAAGGQSFFLSIP